MMKGMKEIIDYRLNSCVDGQDSKNKITGSTPRPPIPIILVSNQRANPLSNRSILPKMTSKGGYPTILVDFSPHFGRLPKEVNFKR
jgi:hypothetical protein